MRILLIGSGGRENALAWKISQSPSCEALFVLPGNPGMEPIATRVPVKPDDFDAIGDFAIRNQIDLMVVGPEVPLVAGIRDHFEERPD
ncbi:MAG: phosphoribosylamine--glycine ligase N-terminal domain-containing protein, partial [Bacteroidota bacterium]